MKINLPNFLLLVCGILEGIFAYAASQKGMTGWSIIGSFACILFLLSTVIDFERH